MAGLLLIQFDYFLLSGGLLIHMFGHLSILAVIFQGTKSRMGLSSRSTGSIDPS
jgi:hypothetical protein